MTERLTGIQFLAAETKPIIESSVRAITRTHDTVVIRRKYV
jgi:hypothetical protein